MQSAGGEKGRKTLSHLIHGIVKTLSEKERINRKISEEVKESGKGLYDSDLIRIYEQITERGRKFSNFGGKSLIALEIYLVCRRYL
ncbi:MAG: hypothetical protein AABX66_03495 [Nanoarchaeota archaeon]